MESGALSGTYDTYVESGALSDILTYDTYVGPGGTSGAAPARGTLERLPLRNLGRLLEEKMWSKKCWRVRSRPTHK